MIVTLILITTFRPHTAGLHYCSKTFSFKWLLVTQNFTFIYFGRFLYWWWGNRQTWLCNKGNVNLVGQFLVSSVKIIGSFNKDDGDGNRNEKRAMGVLSKTTTLHVITLICTFLCCHCMTTTWNCLISCFVKDINK